VYAPGALDAAKPQQKGFLLGLYAALTLRHGVNTIEGIPMSNSTTHGAQSTPQTADTLAEAIAQRCEDAHTYQNGWRARCPAHQGQSDTSLSIEPASDRVLLHCHASCDTEDVLQAMGLKLADLFLTPSLRVNGQTQRTKIKRRIVKVYDYYDVHGTLVHQTVRYEPKDFRQRRPDPANPSKYIWNLDRIESVLYHLPQVLAAVQRRELVYIVEGEKDADALQALGLVATCNAMGAGKWRDSYTKVLRDAHVVILPDNDDPGRKHAALVAGALDRVAASVKVVELPNLADKGDVSDWLTAGGSCEQLETMVAEAPLWEPPGPTVDADLAVDAVDVSKVPQPDEEADTRPVIPITPRMTGVVDAGQAALLALPEAPVIFQRARRLCVIARGVKPPKWLHRPADSPVILEANAARLEELATVAARWEKYDARTKAWRETLPPGWFVDVLQGRPAWPFPVLEGTIGAPTLRPDGSLLDTPGYDIDTGLVYDSNGTNYPPLPHHPTLDDARSAIGGLQEPLLDFLFATSQVHFSAALAAILSVVCRFTIQGTVPLFAVRATTRGSGKSLLVDVLSIIGTGRPAPRWPQNQDEDEDRKRLLTVAMAGDATIHIDNVIKPLGSPALDMALTASTFSDRILGKSAKVEAPLSMVWFASGNNMQFKGDTARRVVPIDLDPQMERPEERDGFRHSPLLPWVRQERPRLVVAALTLIRAYFEAGCPAQGVKPFGSFEAWSDLVRQALIWAGEADPCEGRKDLEAESNPEFETLATLLTCWQACYPTTAITLKRVIQDTGQYEERDPRAPPNQWNNLRAALGACDPKYDGKVVNTRAVGDALRVWQGRVVENKRFVRDGEEHRAIKWCVQVI